MSVAGLECMTTGSVVKRLTLSHHTSALLRLLTQCCDVTHHGWSCRVVDDVITWSAPSGVPWSCIGKERW